MNDTSNMVIDHRAKYTIDVYTAVVEKTLTPEVQLSLKALFNEALRRQKAVEPIERLAMQTLWEQLTPSQKHTVNQYHESSTSPRERLAEVNSTPVLLDILLSCERAELARLRKMCRWIPPHMVTEIKVEMDHTRATIRTLKHLLESHPVTDSQGEGDE